MGARAGPVFCLDIIFGHYYYSAMNEVSKETFETEIVQSDKLVVVDFWGPQ